MRYEDYEEPINNPLCLKNLTSTMKNKVLLSKISKAMGQVKKNSLNKGKQINFFSPNRALTKMAFNAKKLVDNTSDMAHIKSLSSCSITNENKEICSEIQQNNNPKLSLNKQLKNIKSVKGGNITTLSNDSHQPKALVKSLNHDTKFDYEDSTRDVSNGVRIERLKGKLKKFTHQSTRAIQKNEILSASPSGHKAALGVYKKNCIVVAAKFRPSFGEDVDSIKSKMALIRTRLNLLKDRLKEVLPRFPKVLSLFEKELEKLS